MNRRTLLIRSLAFTAAPALISAQGAAAQGAAKLRELYKKDNSFSEFANSNEGQRVSFEGYMAPPLKAESHFFVLTKMPMATCPFCESETEWPDDILAVYSKRVIDVIPFNVNIVARGVLELGSYRDPETGFLSLVRLTDATYERD